MALTAFGALPALWEDREHREGEWEEWDGSVKHLAMPSEHSLDLGGSPGLGDGAQSPRQRAVKAAQDGKKGRAHPIQWSLGKGHVSSVCTAR